ncbi:MAG: FAD-dependent thymidylate synthase [Candidatus Delongbacteria bacterium]|nr:FAD-dependent thymidylate synthase [Candidatus Delongbacteria bacterium]MBN2836497.1 FAD-dependent thymidylate synthase [Candidatus Delongbacteria bacterium]
MSNFRIENFTDSEKTVLSNYFTNYDKPVFGLINMPEVVKGALFARYSRSEKSLRRLFLDEFYKDGLVSNVSDNNNNYGEGKASELYDRMFIQYGDDSVAQLGGAHIACEQVSNILTKFIEKGRLNAYLEQSTRYVYYNKKYDGKYNYLVPDEFRNCELEELFCKRMDNLFDVYTKVIDVTTPDLERKYPKQEDVTTRAWKSTIRAKACDIARGLLPASTRTNLGIYANGQSYEYMLVRMYASDIKEIKTYADMILNELRKMIPSFMKRVDLSDRGIQWSEYLHKNNVDIYEYCQKFNFQAEKLNNDYDVKLYSVTEKALNKVIFSILYDNTSLNTEKIHLIIDEMSEVEKTNILKLYSGDRKNRRHKGGRALESVKYGFDIVSDYGAFRDIQRHRMLTIEWQKINPYMGFVVPEELNEFPELKVKFVAALEDIIDLYESVFEKFGDEVAQYCVPFAYKMRYRIEMSLREAIYLIELRTQKQGHPSYRRVCLAMRDSIRDYGHSYFTDIMNFVDEEFYIFSREDAEKNIDKKLGNS